MPQLLDQLRPIVQTAPERVTRTEAWQRHATAADVLLGVMDVVERGCWEYFDEEATAKAMFDDWCRPVLDAAVPRQEPSGIPTYRDAGPRYVLFTGRLPPRARLPERPRGPPRMQRRAIAALEAEHLPPPPPGRAAP